MGMTWCKFRKKSEMVLSGCFFAAWKKTGEDKKNPFIPTKTVRRNLLKIKH